MTLRIVEIVFDPAHEDTVAAVLEQLGTSELQRFSEDGGGRRLLRVLVSTAQVQAVTDRLQTALGGSLEWRITVLPVEATIPELQPGQGSAASREALVGDVAEGARFSANFVLLTVLSVILAWIGLVEGNLAVIIGAMLIAPLLGPNLALSVGAALGHVALIRAALLTNSIGLALTFALAAGLGFTFGFDAGIDEIATRTRVGPSDIVLAVVAGAAAVLSLTTGLPSALVGVMVAVALMPPAVVAGSLLGAARWDLAMGASLLLGANVVGVNLASQVVLIWKGVRPRTGSEQLAASAAVRVNLAAWLLLLALVGALTWFGVGR